MLTRCGMRRLIVGAGVLAGLCSSALSPAAPKPLPDLTPEEIQLRTLVAPLREGVTEGAELQPLLDWLDAREAAGQGRDAERELRRVLKRINDDQNKDLLRAAEWVRVLQIQRSKLYTELSEDTISLKRAVEKAQEFAPPPVEDEILPGHAEISDAFLGGDMRATRNAPSANDTVDETLPETDDAGTTDLDAPRLMDRLTLDLTALQHLLHECDNEYEREQERHRTALAALTEVLKVRRGANRPKT